MVSGGREGWMSEEGEDCKGNNKPLRGLVFKNNFSNNWKEIDSQCVPFTFTFRFV